MDPQATLEAALEACVDKDGETARDLFEELTAWLRRGGFCPKVRSHGISTCKYFEVQ